MNILAQPQTDGSFPHSKLIDEVESILERPLTEGNPLSPKQFSLRSLWASLANEARLAGSSYASAAFERYRALLWA